MDFRPLGLETTISVMWALRDFTDDGGESSSCNGSRWLGVALIPCSVPRGARGHPGLPGLAALAGRPEASRRPRALPRHTERGRGGGGGGRPGRYA